MKRFYFTLITLFTLTCALGQSYEFALVHNGGYNFSVVAIPDFDSVGDTDISDIGFALMLPAGNADVANLAQFNGRVLSSTQVDAATLSANGLGDGTRDSFLINLPPGQTILAHTSGQLIVVTSFDITNMPTSGQLEILANSDPIAQGLGGAFDSFYNSNIDNTSTQDYFGGIAAGQGSFMFGTLGIDDEVPTLEFSIHPNPAKNKITVNTDLVLDKVELYDITGKLINTYNTKTLDVSEYNSGVYLLKVFTGTKTTIKRFVKE
ncbi:T9SS type A sorting domain-containing protein [Winogradskyella pulchriflava]|uniref:T9SS type A sorting domain-containing protein n=1 Tax=Winogradskyella pulchriflava TaxID=1110688 RepID=A0ABV6QAU5_9FLAO